MDVDRYGDIRHYDAYRIDSNLGGDFTMKKYQFVSYFPRWCGFNFERFDPRKTDWAYIYNWILRIGFWQIREWSRLDILAEEIER